MLTFVVLYYLEYLSAPVVILHRAVDTASGVQGGVQLHEWLLQILQVFLGTFNVVEYSWRYLQISLKAPPRYLGTRN